MNVDLYEKVWMWGVGVMLTVFFGATAYGAVARQAHPPSHVETIDPATVLSDPRFANRGVWQDADGGVHVTVVGMMFVWLPDRLTVPADTPVTFHLTATDVVHGFQIVRSNGQAMVVPGYVSQFTTRFTPGEYLIACNEYCGLGHHAMAGALVVVPAAEWTGPSTAAPATTETEASHATH